MSKYELGQLIFYITGLSLYTFAMYTDMEIFLSDRVYKLTGFSFNALFQEKKRKARYFLQLNVHFFDISYRHSMIFLN